MILTVQGEMNGASPNRNVGDRLMIDSSSSPPLVS